jgi:hypothetical protein
MKYTFKNNLEQHQMHMHVEIRKRTQYDQDLEKVKWGDVQKIVSKDYISPAGYTLGSCINHMQNLHSDYRCSTTWIFELKKIETPDLTMPKDLPLKEETQFVLSDKETKKPLTKRKKSSAPVNKKKVVKK